MRHLLKWFMALAGAFLCTSAWAAELTEVVDMATLIGNPTTLATGVTNNSDAYADGNTVYNFTGEGSIYGLTNTDLASVIETKTAMLVVAAWVKPTAASTMSIFSTGGQTNGFKFDLTASGIQCTTKGKTDTNGAYSIPRDGETWTLVALSLPLSGGDADGRLHITAVNGQHLTKDFGDITDADPVSFGIGTGDSNSDRECFKGAIANLKVFTATALPSNSEIAAKMGDAPVHKTATTEDADLTTAEINALYAESVFGVLTVPADTTITFTDALTSSVKIASEGSVTLATAEGSELSATEVAKLNFSQVAGAVKRASVTATSIGVNFNSACATDVSDALVADGAWTHTTGNSSSDTIADDLSTVTWSCNNLYTETSSGNTYSTGPYSFLQGYLDDGGNGVSIKVTNIPYAKYDLYIYCETDTENTTFSRKTVNGVDYTCDTTGIATVNDTAGGTVGQWGASGSRGTTIPRLGINTMCVQGLSGSELTISSAKYTGRGCIAAIQIVDVSTVVRADLNYGRTAETVANGTIISAHLSTAEVQAGQFEITVSNTTAPTGLTWHLYYDAVEFEGEPTCTLTDGKLVVTFTKPALATFEDITFGDATVKAAVVEPSADFFNADVNPIIQADGTTPYYAAKVTGRGGDTKTRVFGGSSVKTALDASLNLLVTGGDFSYVHGGSNSDAWQNSSAHNVTGDIYVEMAGGSTDWLFGGNYKDGYGVTLGGDIDVVVSGDAVINKTIAGGSFGAHRNSTTYGSATAPVEVGVTVKNVQSTTTEVGQNNMPTGYIVGGGIFATNGSTQTLNGNSSVTVDLADGATGTFVKNIVGGHYVSGSDTGSHQVTGNTTVTVKAPAAVNFTGNLYAGGYGGSSSVGGTSTINLYGGNFTGKIAKGQVNANNAYALNIYGNVNIAEVEDPFVYTVAENASLTLGKADLSHVTTALTIKKGATGTISLGINRNVTFAGFEGGEVELTTDETVTSTELTVAEGVTDCSSTIFKVNGEVMTGTIADGKLTLSNFDASDYTAPFSATLTADANWAELAWTDTNGNSVPAQIWGLEDETPAVELTVADSVETGVTISLPIEMTLGAVKVTAGEKTLTLNGAANSPLTATSLEVVSGTVAYDGVVVLPATTAIAEGAIVNYTANAAVTLPSFTGAGKVVKTGAGQLNLLAANTYEATIVVQEGNVETAGGENARDFTNKFNFEMCDGTQLKLIISTKLYNTDSTLTFHGGSKFIFLNANAYCGQIKPATVICEDATAEKPVRFYGSLYGNNANVSGAMALNGVLSLETGEGADNAYTISGAISGNGSLVVNDMGVTLSGANTYTGTTTVNESLTMTGAAVLPGAVSIAAEKTLTLNGTTLNGGITGTGTLAVAGGTVTLGGYVENADEEKAVVPEGMPVTVASGATLDITTESGISWTSFTGEGTLKISASNYTLGIGGSNNGNTLTTSLVVPQGTELWFRVWRDYTVSIPSLTVDGTMKVDNRASAGGGTLTLEVANEKTLAGAGTIDYGVSFADGAVLDASAGALTINGTVTCNGTVTVTLPTAPGAILKAANLDVTKFTATCPADTKLALGEDGLYLVACDYVAEANGGNYETLAEAIEALGETGGEVTLLQGVDLSNVTIPDNVTIKLGEVSKDDVTLPADYKWDAEGNLVKKVYVAQIGETNYETLQAAVDVGGEVMLVADVADGAITVTDGQNVTLDLNGHTVTVANTDAGNITVEAGATLNIKDSAGEGKIVTNTPYSTNTTATYGLIEVFGTFNMESGTIDATCSEPATNGQYAIVVKDSGKVDVSGGTIKAGWFALSANNLKTTANAVINITGGTFESTADYAIYLPHEGSTTIEGAAVKGAAGAIAQKAGKLTILGGTFTSTGSGNTGTSGDGTGTLANAVLNIDARYANTETTIDRGTFTAEGNAIELIAGTDTTYTITKDVAVDIDAPEGYKWDDDGKLVVDTPAEPTYVAQVGETKYETLAAAIEAAASEGGTVTIIGAVTVTADDIATGVTFINNVGDAVTIPEDYTWNSYGKLVVKVKDTTVTVPKADDATGEQLPEDGKDVTSSVVVPTVDADGEPTTETKPSVTLPAAVVDALQAAAADEGVSGITSIAVAPVEAGAPLSGTFGVEENKKADAAVAAAVAAAELFDGVVSVENTGNQQGTAKISYAFGIADVKVRDDQDGKKKVYVAVEVRGPKGSKASFKDNTQIVLTDKNNMGATFSASGDPDEPAIAALSATEVVAVKWFETDLPDNPMDLTVKAQSGATNE